jgi:hypothetical protein
MGRDVENRVERIERNRFNVPAGVTFEWSDANGMERCGQGVTRDISAKSCSYSPTVCLQAKLIFDSRCFSVLSLRQGRILQLEAEGVVLRVEPAPNLATLGGFAVLNKSHNLADFGFLEPLGTYRCCRSAYVRPA